MAKRPYIKFRLTVAEAEDIKTRYQAGENGMSLAKDYRQFSHTTICCIARGEYDHAAINDKRPALTTNRFQELMSSWQTPEQLDDIEI